MFDTNRINSSSFLIIGCIWFAAATSLLSDSMNRIALYVALPVAFVLSWYNNKQCRLDRGASKYIELLFALYVWITISVFWASDLNLAFRQLKQIWGAFIFCYTVSVNAKKLRFIPCLYFTFIILLIGDWYYAYNNIFGVIDLGIDRLDDDMLNANSLAYHTFYVTIALYMLGEVLPSNFNRLAKIAFLCIIPLSFYTAILTASRQILLIQVPLIGLLLFFRYWKGTKISRKIFFLIAAICTLFLFRPKVKEIYDNSTLKARAEINVEDDSRTKLVKDACYVAMEHMPLGVGANNYILYSYNRHFSHNNYLELLANEGVVGLCLYLSIVLRFIRLQIKRYYRYRDKVFAVFLVFGIFYIIDGVFYVFYPQIWLIGFFMLVAAHSETYYKTKYLNYAS